MSAYIPTNVISITDGQIYLQPDLFFAGVRPAVDVGISVSRVGGNAQIGAMKQVAGGLRLDLAAFRDWKRSPSSAPNSTRRRSRSSTAATAWSKCSKQPQFKPMNVIDQVMIIFAGTKGFLDKVPREAGGRPGRSSSCTSCASRRRKCGTSSAKDKKLTKELEADLTQGRSRRSSRSSRHSISRDAESSERMLAPKTPRRG